MNQFLLKTCLSATGLGVACLEHNLFHGPFLEKQRKMRDEKSFQPKVSLLIPVRNEERNMPSLLAHISKLEYESLEVIFLDDHSTDSTAKIISHHDEGIKIINGRPLPTGWNGKNWACKQLADHATGDIWIFCDADVLPKKDSVQRTVNAFIHNKLDAMSCLGRQNTATFSEAAILPQIMQLPLFCYLPVNQVMATPFPSVSAAHGAWLAFKPEAYHSIGGHDTVKNIPAEDLEFARLIKDGNRKFGLFISRSSLEIRMYHGLAETWNGFGRTLPSLMKKVGGPVIPLLFILLTGILPWFLAFRLKPVFVIPLIFRIWTRLRIARFYEEDYKKILLDLPGAFLTFFLIVHSWYNSVRGRHQWKGRNLLNKEHSHDTISTRKNGSWHPAP